MRPIKLRLEAFGAYVKRVDLDFDKELGGGNFFLIHGATGSGKTTLLDAICFALYGEASGGDRSGKMMRSEFATPAQETYVEFTFALKDKTYCVRRNPEYEKQKMRGIGTTTVKANADLYCDNKLLMTGASKVTKAVEELIGFKCEQFRQVIVLPQGDFSQFLKAGSGDREEILTILFKTEMYRRIEKRLKDRAAELKRDYDAKEQLRRSLLSETGAASVEELAKLLETLDGELQSAEQNIRQLQATKDAASKTFIEAQALEKLFVDLERQRNELKSAASTLEKTRVELTAARSEFETRRLEEPERLELDRRIVELTKALEKLTELKSAKIRAESELKALERARSESADAKRRVEKYEKALEEIRVEEKQLEVAASKLESAREFLKQCVRRDELKSEVERLQKATQTAASEVNRLESDRVVRQKELDRLKHLSREGRAAILAAGLEEGEACPVCGSTHHPRLAMSDEIIPTDEEIEKVDREVKAIEARKSSAEKKSSARSAELESKREELTGYSKLPTTERAQSELRAAETASAAHLKCRERLTKGAEYVDKEKRRYETQHRAEIDCASRAAAAEQSVKEKRQSLPDGCNDGDETRVSLEINSLRSKLEGMKNAFDAADRKCRQLERDQATAASRLQTLEKSRAELVEQIGDRERPDLSTLEANFRNADAALIEAQKNSARLGERRTALTDRRERLSKLDCELVSIESEYKVWARLSNAANGKVSFSRYVLHTMFEDIIEEANARLSVMSERRYLLVDREGAAGRRQLEGLELQIYDEYTESKREVRTLSGGESFLASLSLALGLADVVQNYSGGIKLDTIFIDEGFGSLDGETLDQAIRSLMDLQSDGRLVGIISHVEELRRRIPIRLEVSKSRKGSAAYFARQ